MKINRKYIKKLISEELNSICEESLNEQPYTLDFLQPRAEGVTAVRRQAIVDASSEDEAISKLVDRFPDAKRIMVTESKKASDPYAAMGLLLKARYRLQDIKDAKKREKPEDLGVIISPALDKLEEELLELIDILPSMLKF